MLLRVGYGAPICALPPLSDSLRESESHLNVQCWTLMFVMGVCRATGGVQVSYSWGVTQMKDVEQISQVFPFFEVPMFKHSLCDW